LERGTEESAKKRPPIFSWKILIGRKVKRRRGVTLGKFLVDQEEERDGEKRIAEKHRANEVVHKGAGENRLKEKTWDEGKQSFGPKGTKDEGEKPIGKRGPLAVLALDQIERKEQNPLMKKRVLVGVARRKRQRYQKKVLVPGGGKKGGQVRNHGKPPQQK